RPGCGPSRRHRRGCPGPAARGGGRARDGGPGAAGAPKESRSHPSWLRAGGSGPARAPGGPGFSAGRGEGGRGGGGGGAGGGGRRSGRVQRAPEGQKQPGVVERVRPVARASESVSK